MHAFPIQLSPKKQMQIGIATTSVFEYVTRNSSFERPAHAAEYMGLRNKLDLHIQYDAFIVGGRLDTFNFIQDRKACPSGFLQCKSTYLPEKLYLKYRTGPFEAVAGDFYLTLGRGLALSIRKVDEFGIDTTLRGARTTYSTSTTKWILAGGFVNNSNFDPTQQVILSDINDFIFGTRLEHRLAPIFALGTHYVHHRAAAIPDEAATDKSASPISYAHIFGGSFQLDRIGKKVDLYFEGNALIQQLYTSEIVGYAFYTSINGYFFPVTVRLEGQYYRNYRLGGTPISRYKQISATDPPGIPADPLLYINPPSMENMMMDNYGETSDVRGFRVRLDYTYPNRKALIYINYLFRAGFPPSERDPSLLIHHIFAGLEARPGIFDIHALLGWRELLNFPNWQTFHIDFNLSFAFLPKQSMKLFTRYNYNLKEEYTYHIFDFQLAWSYAKVFTIAFLLSYSNEQKDTPSVPGWNKDFFIGGEAKLKLFGYGSIKVAYGRTRGGLRCVSGVCRNYPSFEGFQTELQLRF